MHKSITNSNNVQQTNVVPSEPSSGSPVYVAVLTIDTSKIQVEISNSVKTSLTKEFDNSSDGIEDMIYFLEDKKIKGARLIGNKRNCSLLAERLVRESIRPLISGSIKEKRKKSSRNKLDGMPVINDHVAGIDIGKSMIIVAVPPHLAEDHTRAFTTFTDDLMEIVKWLVQLKITEIAMESTSVYWVALFDLCQRHGIKPLIVNPKHVKMLPGRKTDVLDAQWLMRLLACGLLQGGFIPPQEIRALRDLARYRQDLMDRAGDCLNLMHKMLSLMNIQLGSVLSDISGKSSTLIINAIVSGERDPEKLAALADKHCKSTPEEIVRALIGTYNEEHLCILKNEKGVYDHIHKTIVEIEMKIKELLEKLPDAPNPSPLPTRKKKQPKRKKREYDHSPYHFDLRALLFKKFNYDLTQISGIEESSAAVIIFEIGGSVEAFPTLKHFASWSAVCPGNKVSGGKMLSGKSPKKFSRVGQAFRTAAHANYKSDSALGAHLRRLVRNGKTKKVARKATAHKICKDVYNIIKYGHEYVEKGAAEYESAYDDRKAAGCIKALKALGYDCSKIAKKAA